MTQEQYVYNIGAVERMTGIPAATLRVWERRYDFPRSKRTEGRHRLYSNRHIAALRWVKDKIGQGVQTKHAIEMLRQFEQTGQLDFEDASSLPLSRATEIVNKGMDIHSLTRQLTDALVRGDLTQAETLFQNEMALYPPENIILHILLPTFVEIGRRWEAGELSISNEHLATQYLRHRIIMWLHTGPPTYDIPPIVMACAPDELHEGALLALSTLLLRRRWPIAYLGQSVPLDDLAQFVKKMSPSAIIVAAMREQAAEALAHWPEAMPEVAANGKLLFGYGGRIFVEQPQWRAKIPGIYLGDDIQSAVDVVERHLGRWPK